MNARRSRAAMLVMAAALMANDAEAGPDKVTLPADWATMPVIAVVDKPLVAQVRVMHMNQEAVDAVSAGKALASGTTIVMVDYNAEKAPDGAPKRDDLGRMVPGPEILVILVQQKGAGWGAEYPPEWRNGEWEYALFTGKGQHIDTNGLRDCFVCHTRAAHQDYTFAVFDTIEAPATK
jgi:hypothetical protein